MRVAIVGGTRFIGAATVRQLLKNGHQVHVLHRGEHPNPNPQAKVHRVDRTDPIALKRAIETASPEAVIDTRAMTRQDATTMTHALAGLDVSLVVLSSQDVYAQFGRLLDHPAPKTEARITEESPLTVPYPYRHIEGQHGHPDYDKKEVERRFREAVHEDELAGVTVLRLPATYGKGDPNRRFGAIVDALDFGDGTLPHAGGAKWRWTHGHVEDIARAITLATEARSSGFQLFNVGDEETPTMGQWAERFADYMGKTVRWVEVDGEPPEELEHLGIVEPNVVVDSRHIRERLGFVEITTQAQKVADIVAWARESRPADVGDSTSEAAFNEPS